MISVGIDNGLDGAIVALNREHQLIFRSVMPTVKGEKRNEYDLKRLAEVFTALKKQAQDQDETLLVSLERSLILPISGRISIASTAFGNGAIQGILTALQIPFQVVRPAEWQKSVLTGMDLTDTKKASILWCKRRFPEEDWRPTTRATREHTGLCDATCIAKYGFLS